MSSTFVSCKSVKNKFIFTNNFFRLSHWCFCFVWQLSAIYLPIQLLDQSHNVEAMAVEAETMAADIITTIIIVMVAITEVRLFNVPSRKKILILWQFYSFRYNQKKKIFPSIKIDIFGFTVTIVRRDSNFLFLFRFYMKNF